MKLAVMLDPGHGGSAPGACANGLKEKDINWKTCVEVKVMLTARGIKTELTRKENECPGLNMRALVAEQWGADILVSVHHNAGGGVGFEIYRSVKGTKDDELAELLKAQFKTIGQVQHGAGGGIYTRTLADGSDYYGVLRYSAALGIPAIIGEFCYIDSVDHEKVISDYLIKQEAEAYAKAICELCGVAWELKDKATLIAEALKAKGWSNSPDYWTSVLQGKQGVNLEYLTALLAKAAGI